MVAERFSYDWTRFQQKIHIKASPARVFRAWTHAPTVSRWFTVKTEIDLRKGGRLYYEWQAGDRFEGRVLAVRKPNRFAFTFGPKGEQVEVRISKAGKGSVVELTQSGMKTTLKQRVQMHLGCQTGWTFFLTNLKAFLEHGLDLRGMDPKRSYKDGYVNS